MTETFFAGLTTGILTGWTIAACFIAVYQIGINKGYEIAIRMLRNRHGKELLEDNKDIVSNISYMQRMK